MQQSDSHKLPNKYIPLHCFILPQYINSIFIYKIPMALMLSNHEWSPSIVIGHSVICTMLQQKFDDIFMAPNCSNAQPISHDGTCVTELSKVSFCSTLYE